MKCLIRIYTCDIPLNLFHKTLRVLSSVRHFFSVAHDIPLTFFHKILRVLSSVRHFFSVAHDIPLIFFTKCCGLSLLRRHFDQYYPNNNCVVALPIKRERIMPKIGKTKRQGQLLRVYCRNSVVKTLRNRGYSSSPRRRRLAVSVTQCISGDTSRHRRSLLPATCNSCALRPVVPGVGARAAYRAKKRRRLQATAMQRAQGGYFIPFRSLVCCTAVRQLHPASAASCAVRLWRAQRFVAQV